MVIVMDEQKGARRRRPCLTLDLQSSGEQQQLRQNVTRIMPFLYMGGDSAICDKKFLQHLRVGTIINCTARTPNFFPGEFKHVRVPLSDTADAQLIPHLDPALQAIEAARRCGTVVLVHCNAGISRSAAVALAFLLKHCNMTLLEALEFTRSRRPQISPNPAFLAELVQLEKLFHGRVTVDVDRYIFDRFADARSLSLAGSGSVDTALQDSGSNA